jgi:PAS domain S-box-containing protein
MALPFGLLLRFCALSDGAPSLLAAQVLFTIRDTALSFPDMIAVIFLVAAVAMVTWLVTRLQARSNLLESLFDHAPPIALTDAEHRVVRINPEFSRTFGYSASEVQGRSLADLIIPPESQDIFARNAARLMQGQRVESEMLQRCKDGGPLYVLAIALPITTADGKLLVLSLFRDITQAKAAEIALQTLSARLLEVQEIERKHLARELHDEIGQLLTGLRLLLRTGADLPSGPMRTRLEQAHELIDDLLTRVRKLSFDLRPADLDHFGLLPALLALFEKYSDQTGILINFKHHGIERRFSAPVETAAYRIVQEALTNAARYAGVAGVTVTAWSGESQLKLQIVDRGCGFDPEVGLKSQGSSGLLGMKERISLLGGSLSLESAAGAGTAITAELPVDRPRDSEVPEL